jgi:hypothetical protein
MSATLNHDEIKALRARLESGNPDFPLSDIRALVDTVTDLQGQVEQLTAPKDNTKTKTEVE